jgi:dTDP-4-dehydrorhamnose reductase
MILVTGAKGQLGGELSGVFDREAVRYAAFDIDEWDIADLDQGLAIIEKFQPKVLINCAAYTAVDRAESDRENAYLINAEAVRILKSVCSKYRVYLIHISTDYVFGGSILGGSTERRDGPWRPEEPISPQGVYAETKGLGERLIAEENRGAGRADLDGATIMRTSWLYAAHGANFPRTILRLAGEEGRDRIDVVEDQIGRPTWAGRLAEFIYKYIQYNKLSDPSPGLDRSLIPGEILHFANSGIASWYDFAHGIVETGCRIGLLKRRVAVRPISTTEYPLPAPRPPYSVLDLKSAERVQPLIPHWRDDLEICLRQMMGKESP